MYQLGRKLGQEIYRSVDGKKEWEWIYGNDGSSVYRQWWPTEKIKSESHWQGKICTGLAKQWDVDGKLISTVKFVNGESVP